MTAIARFHAAFGALACGIAVALGAYASHAAQAQDARRLAIAAAFAFAHGLALLIIHTRASRLANASMLCFAIGVVLFSGSLALAVFFGVPTALAPFGGSLLMLGWGILAFEFIRSR